MNELALHILDIVQNSISAKARLIEISIIENAEKDLLEIDITDNGKGIAPEMLENVTDAYVTSRTTRKVGLGLPLLKQNAEQTGGSLKIESELGKGTVVKAVFGYSHWDRPPIGDIAGTICLLVTANPDIDFVYLHKTAQEEYIFDTKEVKEALGDVPISSPEVYRLLKEMIEANLDEIGVKLN
jgi:anti-sigma regulatory factor (Ser/Thr protein kinase)